MNDWLCWRVRRFLPDMPSPSGIIGLWEGLLERRQGVSGNAQVRRGPVVAALWLPLQLPVCGGDESSVKLSYAQLFVPSGIDECAIIDEMVLAGYPDGERMVLGEAIGLFGLRPRFIGKTPRLRAFAFSDVLYKAELHQRAASGTGPSSGVRGALTRVEQALAGFSAGERSWR